MAASTFISKKGGGVHAPPTPRLESIFSSYFDK